MGSEATICDLTCARKKHLLLLGRDAMESGRCMSIPVYWGNTVHLYLELRSKSWVSESCMDEGHQKIGGVLRLPRTMNG
jgi:hypothetical protein